MPWSSDNCAAFLKGRRRRQKYAHPLDAEVEQATANPGEKRQLPRCWSWNDILRCERARGHDGSHEAHLDDWDYQW